MSNPNEEQELDCFQSMQVFCGGCCGTLSLYCPCVFGCFVGGHPYKTVYQSEIGLVERFGKFKQQLQPGYHQINLCVDTIKVISGKVQILNLPKQVLLTKDNITLQMDAQVYYKVVDVYKATYNVDDIQESLRFHAFSVLRNVCGQNMLQDFLEKKTEIRDIITQYVTENIEQWGIEVTNVYIKEIILNRELQNSLSSAARERRLAQSKIISAKADVESAKLMREAADILDSKSAMQIRFLETLQGVVKNGNKKIMFMALDQQQK